MNGILGLFLIGLVVVLNSRCIMSAIGDTICLSEENITVITSPRFPDRYLSNVNAEWTLFSSTGGFLLNFTLFDIEASYDFLYVEAGNDNTFANFARRLHGRIDIVYNIFVVEFPYLYLRFTSDFSIEGAGFRVEITAVNATALDVCERRPIANSEICNFHLFCESGVDEVDCRELASGQRLEISSSTFPHIFHRDELYFYREWRFASTSGYQINFTLYNVSDFRHGHLDIEASMHSDEILYTNRFYWENNTTVSAYAFDTRLLKIHLRLPNDFETTEDGITYSPLQEFRADILVRNVSSIIDCSKVCVNQLLTDPSGEVGLTFKGDINLDIKYNCICEWNITVGESHFIKLNITSINIPCDLSNIQIFSSWKSNSSASTGRLCGSSPRLIISDSNTLLLRLPASAERTGYGFRAFYDEIERPGCGMIPTNGFPFVDDTLCTAPTAFIASSYYLEQEQVVNQYWHISTHPSSYIEVHFEELQLYSTTRYCEENYLVFHTASSTLRLCNMNLNITSLPFFSDKNELKIELGSYYYWGSKFLAFYNEIFFLSSVNSIELRPNLTCMDLPQDERQHCFCLFNDQKNVTWIEAINTCQHCGDGGYLATIRSQRDMDFLQQLILEQGEPLKSTYIGLYWDDEKKSHKWADGDPLSFSSWRISRNFENRQPDSGGEEKCTMITLWSYRETNNWQDVPCGEPLTTQFICHVSYAIPGPSPVIEYFPVDKHKELCGQNQYRCLSGECLLSIYFCDDIYDCFDKSDELNCSTKPDQMCSAFQFTCDDGSCIHSTLYCDFIPHCEDGSDERRCEYPLCTVNEFRCDSGRCIPIIGVCDMLPDCDDGSDEKDCAILKDGFRCFSGRILPNNRICDGYRDCPGKDWEDEPYDCYYFHEFFECNTTMEIRCASGVCANSSTRCIFEYDVFGFFIGCRDATHLLQCEHFQCPTNHFKCRDSYCIPERYRCNGEIDCPYGEDEKYCESYKCANGSYKCHGASNHTCLPQSQVCDAVVHCLGRDDERYCDLQCPDECECVGSSYNCSNAYWRQDIADKLPIKLKQLFLVDVTRHENLELQALNDHGRNSSLDGVTVFDVVLRDVNDFHFLHRLHLSGGNIQIIRDGDFQETRNLIYLYLDRNNITTITEGSFYGLDKLKYLNLSGNPLTMIGERPFKPLKSLEILSITATNIPQDRENIFNGAENLLTLYSDKFYFCCLDFSPPADDCYPKAGQFSGCDNLMRNSFLRVNLWLLGIAAVVGNGFVFIFRIYRRDVFPDRDRNPAQAILIANLAIADFCIGIYMLIIAGADLRFKDVYFRFSEIWQTSNLCKFAGFLSVVGSEASVMFLTVITVDRFQNVIFPFNRKKLRFKSTLLVAGCVWTLALVISGLPLIPFQYFGESYYGRSSVCLALPLTNEYRPGWLYSIFVFLVFNFLSFSAMLVCYVIIYTRASKSLRFSGNVKSTTDRQVQIAMRMFFLVFTDMACWMPVIIMGMLSQSRLVKISGEVYAWTAVLILPVNSALNPYLYTFLIKAAKRKSLHSRVSLSNNQYNTPGSTITVAERRLSTQDHVNAAFNGKDVYMGLISDLISDVRQNHLIVTLTTSKINERSLSSLKMVRKFSLSEKEKEDVKMDVSKGLSCLHDNNIIHGRISEEYVVIDESPDEEVRAYLLYTPPKTESPQNNNDDSFEMLQEKDLRDLEIMLDAI